MTSCPNCGKPVDPVRAPAAKVRDGRVVAYCSKECAAAAETKPVVVPPPAEPAPPPAKLTAKQAKLARRTPEAGVPLATPKSVKDVDSGPIIEIIKDSPSRPVVAKADKVRSGAIEIADTGHVDDYVSTDEPIHRNKLVVVLLVLLVVAGAAFAAYSLGYLDKYLGRGEAASAQPPAPPAPPTPQQDVPPEPPRVKPADAVDRAKKVLATLLQSHSPRVQRVAASALARTKDAAAITLLATALTKEDSELARLEIAYALARGGDKRGTDALATALGVPRRDVKAEAARLLALLGDKRAVGVLEDYLGVSQLRLGAAEQLAYLGDPRALDTLDKITKDDKATPDDRARATIALGLAGKTEVADALRTLLADARQNAFAADALAILHDPAARPVLVKQLAIPSLRVRAARALRKLEPNLDSAPILPGLLDTLASAKDTEQAQAAEAVLLLAGPPEWSERE